MAAWGGSYSSPVSPSHTPHSQVLEWSEGKERPASSTLVQLITAEGETKMVAVNP